ncbi:hypothetical protein G3N55_02345 [Dissulfurirhabdus thermomarina]|uniref:Uncharacterized protein n=1 Tax=Dissulfurirhabdus thermomarina TaxID=1765737 RepID=A0A6N9TPM7_DISTH|nr:hypothetical protein [Dissulfurirhabdus thermomarina]NDY41694.1 hypothetical protein [Dissulfurirhabdus thermomarina]NMX22738.1 hypothetical protein [Dissulfurirhabdus thermomarina]
MDSYIGLAVFVALLWAIRLLGTDRKPDIEVTPELLAQLLAPGEPPARKRPRR